MYMYVIKNCSFSKGHRRNIKIHDALKVFDTLSVSYTHFLCFSRGVPRVGRFHGEYMCPCIRRMLRNSLKYRIKQDNNAYRDMKTSNSEFSVEITHTSFI